MAYNELTKRMKVLCIKASGGPPLSRSGKYTRRVCEFLGSVFLQLIPWLHLLKNVLPRMLLQATALYQKKPNTKLPPLQVPMQLFRRRMVQARNSLAMTRRTGSCFAPGRS